MNQLRRWRTLALTQSAESVLDAILEDTHYEAHIMGGPRAEAALRNIDELRSRMRLRERQSNHAPALADFLRALDTDRGVAPEQEDESLRNDPDAVQIMTVHKSKGLEFPVVFLAQMAQPYQQDARSSALLFSPGGSMALAAVDPVRKVRLDPPSLAAMHSTESRASRGEEIRLLYVAMTRARERLILVGCAKGLRKHTEAGGSLIELSKPAPAFARIRAHTPASLVGPRLYTLARETAPPSWLHIHSGSAIPSPPDGVDMEEVRQALLDSGTNAQNAWQILGENKAALEQQPAPGHAETPPRHTLFLHPAWKNFPLRRIKFAPAA